MSWYEKVIILDTAFGSINLGKLVHSYVVWSLNIWYIESDYSQSPSMCTV